MGRTKVDPDRVRLGELTAIPMKGRGEKEGRRYWRARRTGPDRETVWAGWATRAEVELRLAELIRTGIPARQRSPEAVRTVGDLLVRWSRQQELRHQGGEIAYRSLDNYRRAASHWRGELGDLLVTALTRETVEDTLTKWQAVGISPRSCKLFADVMSAAVNWGEPRGHCPKVELSRLASVSVDDDEHVNNAHTPTRLELGKVLDQLPVGKARDVILLLALTGARVGEIAALKVGDWTREARTLSLSGRDEKRRRRGKVKVRRWPVAGELAPLLERLAGERDRTEPLVPELPMDCADLVRRALLRATGTAKVPPFTAHGLRRMVAMELLDHADPRRVSELTGHSVATLLRYYVRPRAEDLRELVVRSGVTAVEERGKRIEFDPKRRAQKRGTALEEEE